MDLFLQTIVNGVLIGGILICLTIGFQLTFGVLHVIDFAVGGWVMLGGYAAYWLVALAGIDPFISIFFVFVLFALIGRAVGPLIYHVRTSRYARPDLMALAFTFGLFLLMRGGALWLWSYNSRNVESIFSGEFLTLGPVTIPLLRLSAFLMAIVISLGVFLLLYRTRFGMAVRAVAQNRDHAGLMGVNVKRVSAYVYGLYTGITASAGVLIATIYSVNPSVGVRYTLFAFFVAVLAGLGSVGGVLIAGLALGLMESVVSTYIGTRYSLLVVFGVLFLVLLVAPKGVLGRGI
ncbi:branched-chain amino acid ABC transporter permease [Marinobacter sp. M3C]|uniref:branched-chain amino acid ABC transporter permease n=1 Tax=unclassified Marinobacter TaxID=83889 RepID=UPI0020105460|nr:MULTISPECIES: branched-chain amino acid ABC transporter permease [unclassified Marinobacter]MCL1478741.1 branched-chain amino acid ABC transporter permease [Marinobacter sp.]MCL1481779.1 branched-chain amino acid ABC transporter permease [Marinobacter sp.]MCL1484500.1 branched-chain amino acid ABC transporter permease [Marinobacter sp.]UQG54930.1 branched-chain amino acid ABC transporter permease [Marinobacter sp. M4C]UQG59696.1 branched-chain amino acid ABC transporter permease [Marinobact